MRPFTDEEFEIMISEMTGKGSPSFDMLGTIVEKTLRSKIRYWCAVDPVLSSRGMEDDILQEVFIRLVKTTVPYFLKREDRNGELNNNPDEFKNWMIVVAKRIKADTSNSVRDRDNKTGGVEKEHGVQDDSFDDDRVAYQHETLAEAFRIIIDSDAKIYKVLTWLAQSLFVIGYDVTKIESNDIIIAAFSEKSLFDMWDILLRYAEKIEWIVITPDQIEKTNRALNAEFRSKPIGEIKYKDFFMKKGGKASISDWVYRMNRLIESRMRK